MAGPWARPGSGFTLLFEVAMLTYAKQKPIAPLSKMAREHGTRIWRVIEHHVETARAGKDFSDVTEIGMDETSASHRPQIVFDRYHGTGGYFAAKAGEAVDADRRAEATIRPEFPTL